MNATQTEAQARRELESGPIPEGYCKLVHIGPEGETGLVEVMPEWIGCQQLNIQRPIPSGRSLVVSHMHGVTRITWTDDGVDVETIKDEFLCDKCGALAAFYCEKCDR